MNNTASSLIQIEYFGSIRAAAGRDKEAIAYIAITVYDLLFQLAAQGKALESELFHADGHTMREDLMLTVNQVIIPPAALPQTLLQPGDTIALFPVFPGGG